MGSAIPKKYQLLQAKYDKAHAESGITLKDWVAAQSDLNWNSVRRYLRSGAQPVKNQAVKGGKASGRKRKQCAELNEKAGINPSTAHAFKNAQFWMRKLEEDDRFSRQQKNFCFCYFKHLNVATAAAEAGYKDPRPCYRLIATDHFQEYQHHFRLLRYFDGINECAKQLERIEQFIAYDMNEISTYAVLCCRGCWAENGVYQYMDEREYQYKLDEWERKNAESDKQLPPPDDSGGYGYDPLREPNPRCFMCEGFGRPRAIFHDTRNLSPIGKLLYDGVQIGKDGTKILKPSKEFLLTLTSKYLSALGAIEMQKQQRQLDAMPGQEQRAVELHRARLAEIEARTVSHKAAGGGGGVLTLQLLNAFVPPGAAPENAVDGSEPTSEEMALINKRQKVDSDYREQKRKEAESREEPQLDGKRKQ